MVTVKQEQKEQEQEIIVSDTEEAKKREEQRRRRVERYQADVKEWWGLIGEAGGPLPGESPAGAEDDEGSVEGGVVGAVQRGRCCDGGG